MSQPERREVEQVRGQGAVRQGERQIAEAVYTITVTQAYTPSGLEMVPGPVQIDIRINPYSGDQHFIGKGNLTLDLEDGRELTFFATGGDAVNGFTARHVESKGFAYD